MDLVPASLGLPPHEVAGLLAIAASAPSLHNSQPWRFRVLPQVIELWLDRHRLLPASDPTGREQRLACGAALFNLRLGLHGLGVRPLVTLVPDPAHPDLLASVRFGGRKPPTPTQVRLLEAAPRRHTNRYPFTDEPVTVRERAALRRAALDEGAWLHLVERESERDAVARLVADAHAVQQADPGYRAELARWVAVEPGRPDGVPVREHERRPPAHQRWVKRDFTGGHGPATTALGVVFEHEPAIAVLSAYALGVRGDLSAGQAMQHVLLTATAEGLAASFLSQVIEVVPARTELRRLIGGHRDPQVVLRIGHGWPVPATPRRPLADILIDPADRSA